MQVCYKNNSKINNYNPVKKQLQRFRTLNNMFFKCILKVLQMFFPDDIICHLTNILVESEGKVNDH